MQEPNQAHTAESLTTLCWAWWRSLTPEHKKPQADIAALVQSSHRQPAKHRVERERLHEPNCIRPSNSLMHKPSRTGLPPKIHQRSQQPFGKECENSKPPRAPTMGPSIGPMDESATQYKTWTRQRLIQEAFGRRAHRTPKPAGSPYSKNTKRATTTSRPFLNSPLLRSSPTCYTPKSRRQDLMAFPMQHGDSTLKPQAMPSISSSPRLQEHKRSRPRKC